MTSDRRADGSPSDTPLPAKTPWSRTDRVLLGSIVVMTVLILGGIVAVAVRGIAGPPRGSAPAALRVTGEVGAIGLDGDRLAVHLREAGGEVIVIYDLARGTEEARIPLER